MTYRGHVEKGVIRLERPHDLPDGTEVSVRPIRPAPRRGRAGRRSTSSHGALLKLAGKAKGLPADAARNVDHYLYGHAKR